MTIDVEDDGPGISDARKEVMLEPFVRGDDARNMDEAAGLRSRPVDRAQPSCWRMAASCRCTTGSRMD